MSSADGDGLVCNMGGGGRRQWYHGGSRKVDNVWYALDRKSSGSVLRPAASLKGRVLAKLVRGGEGESTDVSKEVQLGQTGDAGETESHGRRLRRRKLRHYKTSSEHSQYGRSFNVHTDFEPIVLRTKEGGDQTGPDSVQGKIIHHLISGEFDEEFLGNQKVNVLNWCIKVLGKHGKHDIAEQLFHWMRLKGIANEHSLIKLFEAYEASKLPAAISVRVWRNVQRMQCPFKPGEKSTAALLKTFRPRGDLAGAMRILKEVKMRRLPLNHYAYNTLIRISADCGNLNTAMELEEELRCSQNFQPDLRTYSALMHALANAEKWSQTRTIHSLIKKSNISPDATLALQIISGYAKCGWPAAAEATLDDFKDDGTSSLPNRSHWNALLMAYATARQYTGCLSAYQRMTNQVGIPPDGYTIVALLKAGKFSQVGTSAVKLVISEIERYNIQLNIEICISAISCCRTIPFISVEEAKNSAELANMIWKSMIDAGIKPNRIAYNTLMATRADALDIDGVEELYRELEGDISLEPDEATWRVLIRSYEQAGRWRDVENISALRETWRTLHGLTK